MYENIMMAAGQRLSRRLRAFCAALALLIGSIAAPVALAGQPQGVCAMTCCVEVGHCCCNPRQAYVEGEIPAPGPVLTVVSVTAPCPDGCAGSQSSSHLRFREMDSAARHHLNLEGLPFAGSRQAGELPDPAQWETSSPRGPPFLLA
jgi:hypothetical protein